jgi:hypothetical protein
MKKHLCLLSLPLLFAASSASAEVTCGAYLSRSADGGAQVALDDKVSVIVFHNVTQVNTDKGGRYDGPAGNCGGTVTVLPDGTMQASGACTVMDGDGDVAMYQFQHMPGDQRGTFKRTGGSGKFAQDFRSGWYQQTAQQDNGASGLWGGDDEAVCE